MRGFRHSLLGLVASFLLLGACDSSHPEDLLEEGETRAEVEQNRAENEHRNAGGLQFLDFADTVEAVRPAVVNIYTRSRRSSESAGVAGPGAIPRERIEESLGSGFLFDAAGLVLTNDHVIAEAEEISVRLLDERGFRAKVLGRDPQTDLAVLRLEEVESPLPFLTLGDSDSLRVGNWVLAIGNPLGLTSTVTAGIASATGRHILPPGNGTLRFQDFIQTDASINPGNSGGPLVNHRGEVIGIATALSSAGQGLGFAIPINMVKVLLDDLIHLGRVRRSWLGIYVGDVPGALRRELNLDQGGVLITRVVEGGPAEEAGLVPGDILLRLDQLNVDTPARLSWIASNLGVEKRVEVELLRGSEELVLPLIMGALPEN